MWVLMFRSLLQADNSTQAGSGNATITGGLVESSAR
jgi:hypothetical protein